MRVCEDSAEYESDVCLQRRSGGGAQTDLHSERDGAAKESEGPNGSDGDSTNFSVVALTARLSAIGV